MYTHNWGHTWAANPSAAKSPILPTMTKNKPSTQKGCGGERSRCVREEGTHKQTQTLTHTPAPHRSAFCCFAFPLSSGSTFVHSHQGWRQWKLQCSSIHLHGMEHNGANSNSNSQYKQQVVSFLQQRQSHTSGRAARLMCTRTRTHQATRVSRLRRLLDPLHTLPWLLTPSNHPCTSNTTKPEGWMEGVAPGSCTHTSPIIAARYARV